MAKHNILSELIAQKMKCPDCERCCETAHELIIHRRIAHDPPEFHLCPLPLCETLIPGPGEYYLSLHFDSHEISNENIVKRSDEWVDELV